MQVVSRNSLPSSTSTTRKFPACSSLPSHHRSPATGTAPNPLSFHPSTARHTSASTIFCHWLYHLFSRLLFSHRILFCNFCPTLPSFPPNSLSPQRLSLASLLPQADVMDIRTRSFMGQVPTDEVEQYSSWEISPPPQTGAFEPPVPWDRPRPVQPRPLFSSPKHKDVFIVLDLGVPSATS